MVKEKILFRTDLFGYSKKDVTTFLEEVGAAEQIALFFEQTDMLNGEIDVLNGEIDALTMKIAELEKAAATEKSELEKVLVLERTEQASNYDAEMNLLNGEIASLKSKIADYEAREANLNKDYETTSHTLSGEINILNGEIDALTMKIAELEKAAVTEKSELEKVLVSEQAEQASSYDAKINLLNSEIMESRKRISDYEMREASLNKERNLLLQALAEAKEAAKLAVSSANNDSSRFGKKVKMTGNIPAVAVVKSDVNSGQAHGAQPDSERFPTREEICIPKDTIFEGNISTKSNLLIYGFVNGNVVSENDITVVGTVKGNIHAKSIQLNKGTVEGDVNSTDDIYINELSTVNGNVESQTLECNGEVHGDIRASKSVLLKSKAFIEGNISAKSINMQDGSRVCGSVEMPADRLKILH